MKHEHVQIATVVAVLAAFAVVILLLVVFAEVGVSVRTERILRVELPLDPPPR